MNFSTTILGSNSGMPAQGRHPSAQVVQVGQHLFLVDCGEGTQVQMARYRISRQRIKHIFISHLHGDHVFGLAGLITSLNHSGYSSLLTIHGTPGINEMINTQLRLSGVVLHFDINYEIYDITEKHLILDLPDVVIYAFPLIHRIPTIGFLFQEKVGQRPLLIDKVKKHQIDCSAYAQLKRGYDVQTADGHFVDHRTVTSDPHPTRSFAYCSDTLYHEALSDYIYEVDMLFHEATFKHDLLVKAVETRHSTARQAAQMAIRSSARHLLIGHYSSRYRNVDGLELEAKLLFADSIAVVEGNRYGINRSKEIMVETLK